ncbi:MAG TPA: class I SAM-dependent methyltransferase, partial [Nitrospira sp.]|nr:class I SAM-dependent methyltransferase [Nitrospira sp.]
QSETRRPIDPATSSPKSQRSSKLSNRDTCFLRYTLNPHGGTHGLLIRLIPPGSRVLDVGCASGYLGQLLAARQCTVYGIERDQAARKIARDTGSYVDVYNLDLEDDALQLPSAIFDVVLCADVLEHLRDPRRLLLQLRKHIAPSGAIIVSLPNIAHVSVRASLALGRFEYTSTGILDKTHFHLYTFSSARALLSGAGFRIDRELAGSNRFGEMLSFGPRPIRLLRGLLAYNIVLVARASQETAPT